MSDQPDNVGNNAQSTYRLGGCTGRGFMPGQSGNPSGRPKKLHVTEMLERMFEKNPEIIEEAMMGVITGRSAVAKVMLLEKAAERLEGKVTQPVDVTGDIALTLTDRLNRAKARKHGESGE